MIKKQTVSINGKDYDSITGLLVGATAARPARSKQPASQQVHAKTQRSQTLNRNLVTKKTGGQNIQGIVKAKKHVAKSPQISRFAAHVVKTTQTPAKSVQNHPDIISAGHSVAIRTQKSLAQSKSAATMHKHHKPADVVKHEATTAALAKSSSKSVKSKRQSLKQKFPRFFSVASASLAVMLLAGYLTYINMPLLSIKVAAAGAGIDAGYPGYRPDGYRLSGPISYKDGQVSIQFASNSGPQNYILDETKSNWDSSAVLENYVKPKSDGKYVPYQQNGLTIYVFGNDAAWVNGGILYTINSDQATLSNDQILKIATSL